MLPASKSLHFRSLSSQSLKQQYRYCFIDSGFSVLEGIIASIILIVSVLGTAAAFNLIMSSISGTANKNAINSAIDKNISSIKKLSVDYTSCVNPTGSVPSEGACDVSSNFSAYYFPMSSLASEQDKFFDACQSVDAANHITAGFKNAIDALPVVGAGVYRQSAYRENGADPRNHNIIVKYNTNGSTVRLIKVSPVVSSWCG